MLTRQGLVILAAGIVALIVARMFAVVELFVIGAALFAAAVFAVGYVRLRRPKVVAARWIHPSVLVAGDTGRVDIHLDHTGRIRSAPFTLCESVRRTMGDPHEARLPIGSLPARSRTSSGYRLPSAVRGLILLGPLQIEIRDPLGLAAMLTPVADVDEVVVAPRSFALDMPQLGQGVLGSALLDRARRLGPGDFHGLREYAEGDEPRTIHWRASARSDNLMVKEHTVEGLHRCTIVLDAAPGSHATASSFERGVTAAASLVNSAARAGLATRFVTTGGIDLRGPEVSINTMRVLARLEPRSSVLASLNRDTGDGLGLVVVVTGSRRGPAWHAAQAISDPTSTILAVTTDEPAATRMSVGARSEDEFVVGWQSLVGRGRVDLAERRS